MTHTVRIFRPSKNATQSGRGKTKGWIMECEIETGRAPEPLMGWVSSGDTLNQVRMTFETAEEAMAFAQKKGWAFSVIEPRQRKLKGRTYLDNFKYTPPVTQK